MATVRASLGRIVVRHITGRGGMAALAAALAAFPTTAAAAATATATAAAAARITTKFGRWRWLRGLYRNVAIRAAAPASAATATTTTSSTQPWASA